MLQNRNILRKGPQVINDNGVISSNMINDLETDDFTVFDGGYRGPIQRPKVDHPISWLKTFDRRFVGSAYTSRSYDGSAGTFRHISGSLGSQGIDSSIFPNDFPAAQAAALDKLYEKWRGSLDLSIDLYQAGQTRKLVKDILGAARYLMPWNVPLLIKSAIKYAEKVGKRRTTRPLVSDGERVWENTRDVADISKRTTRVLIPKGSNPGPGWRKVSRDAGQLWLAYSYGLKPTVSAVYDSAAELLRNIEPLQKIEAQRTIKAQGDHVKTGYQIAGIPGCKYVNSYWQSMRVKYVVTFAHSNSTLQEIARFSSVNPASFMWENLPFSFVFDWFVDVGGYLRGVESSFLAGSVFRGGTVSHSLKRTARAVVFRTSSESFHNGSNWVTDLVNVSAEAHFAQSQHYRQVLTGPPTPDLPRFQVDFSSPLRALNAISLLAQQWRR